MSPATPKPAYLLKGDEPTLLAAALRELVTTALAGADPTLALEELPSSEDVTASAIAGAASTPAFLADRKVVVARDVGRFDSDELAPVLAWLADPVPGTTVILVAEGGRTSQKLANAVKKVGEVVDASAPKSGKPRGAWIGQRLASAPVSFDRAAADLLERHVGEDVARIDGILATAAAVHGEGARLGVDDIAPLLGLPGSAAPWDLTDAIDRGDAATAIDVLHRLLKGGGRHGMVVLATLTRHYGAMLRLDGAGVRGEAEAAQITGMAPYPAKKVLEQGRRLGTAGIRRAIQLLADADLDLRGRRKLDVEGEPDGIAGLEILVARLARLTPARR